MTALALPAAPTPIAEAFRAVCAAWAAEGLRAVSLDAYPGSATVRFTTYPEASQAARIARKMRFTIPTIEACNFDGDAERSATLFWREA